MYIYIISASWATELLIFDQTLNPLFIALIDKNGKIVILMALDYQFADIS